MTRLLGIVGAVLLLGGALMGSDYPIRDQADSIHPRQDELVLSLLLEPADEGQRIIKIEDSDRIIDTRQWILLKSLDGQFQETHCIKRIRRTQRPDGTFEVEIKLDGDLKYDYDVQTRVIQGSVARERGVAARLGQKGQRGKAWIRVDESHEIDPLEQVILQSSDGLVREAHCVKWVEGEFIKLFQKLKNDYALGSTVIQGGLIDGEIETEESPCCCENKKAGRK